MTMTVPFKEDSSIRFTTGILTGVHRGKGIALTMSLGGGTLMFSYGDQCFSVGSDTLAQAWLEAVMKANGEEIPHDGPEAP